MSLFLSPYYVQKLCLCAFMHKELAKAEINALNGIGEKIVEDSEKVRNEFRKILSYWHTNGLVMKNAHIMSLKSRKAGQFLKGIQTSIDYIITNNSECFSLDKDDKLHWIPAYFVLTILKRLDNFGLKYYPDNISLDELISAFENAQQVKKTEKLAYWKMARLILQKLNYLEK